MAEVAVEGRQARDEVAPVREAVVGAAASTSLLWLAFDCCCCCCPLFLEAEVRRHGFVADSRRAVGVEVDVVADVAQAQGEQRADGAAEGVPGERDFVGGVQVRGGGEGGVDGLDDFAVGEEESEVSPWRNWAVSVLPFRSIEIWSHLEV